MHKFPRQKLCELIATYGESLCDQPMRCKGLLRDFCSRHRREVNLLINALNERVARDLRYASQSTPMELTLGRLTTRLEDQQGLTTETARWAVESWALALGKISEKDLQKSQTAITARQRRPKRTAPQGAASAASSKKRKPASAANPGAGPPPSIASGSAHPIPAPSAPTVPGLSPRPIMRDLLTLISIALGIGGLYYLATVKSNPRQPPFDRATPSVSSVPSLAPTPRPTTADTALSSTVATPAEPASSPEPVSPSVVTPRASPLEHATPPPPPPTIGEGEVRSLIESVYGAFNRGDANALISYYDDEVDYLEYGPRPRVFVRQDFDRHFTRWPSNSYLPRNIVVSTSTTENIARASFEVAFTARNDSAGRVSTGWAHEDWSIRKSQGTIKIFYCREVVHRERAPATLAPASTANDTEEVRAFIAEYLAALSRHDLNAVVAKFDTTVDYQGNGKKGHSYIRGDTGAYLRKWDSLQFQLVDAVSVDQTSDGRLVVSFDFIYAVANNREGKRGRSRNIWTLRRVNGNLRITAQRETIVLKF